MADTARTHHDITSRDQYPILGRDRDQYPYGRSDYQTSGQDYSKTRQIAKAATAVTAGGSLLVLSSLTLVGTVIALTVATPLLVIFSPILVPALITVALLITGFLSSGGFGIAAITVFSWIYKYATGEHPQGSDKLDSARMKLGTKAQDIKDRAQYYGQQHTGDRGKGMLRAAGSGMLRAAGRGMLGAAGRGMLRAAGRAMKRTGVAKGGIQDPFASSPSTAAGNASVSLGGGYVHRVGSNNLRISVASGSLLNLPVAITSRWTGGAFSFNSYGAYEDFEWVTVEGTEEEEEEDSVFSSVPSVDEVEDAVSALKQVFDGGGNQSPMPTGMVHQVPSFGTELDWVEPSMELCHSRILQPHAYDHVYNAFDLLRTEPSVQRMVLSLSSDKAVWKAVRNNEVVQEIKELYYSGINQGISINLKPFVRESYHWLARFSILTDGESSDDESSGDESSDDTPRKNNTPKDFIKWVFESTVVKAAEVLKKIIKLAIELLNSFKVNKKRKRGKLNNWFEEDLKTSVFLSILVMLVVMVSRACNNSMNDLTVISGLLPTQLIGTEVKAMLSGSSEEDGRSGYIIFLMGIRYLSVSVASTALSFVGLQVWTELSLDRLRADGLIAKNISLGDSEHALELLLGSYFTIALLTNFVLNVYILLILSLKTLFFGDLYGVETKKLVERLANYIIYKGTFLPLVIPPTIFQGVLWTVWLTVLCTLKMFQALARDRLERLNASPSSTPWTYFRVYSVLFLVLSVDMLWIKLSLMTYNTIGSSVYLLLLFEPCSIAFETLQALLIHGFQLLDMWINHLVVNNSDCQRSKFLDSMTAGSLLEWKGLLNRNLGFFLDMATLVMALCHYLHIWWLHGIAFHLVDAVLFLNIRALLSAILKRMKGYIKLRIALGSLHAALPDATSEELRAYDDECAICREPMAKAKRLHCNHLFHLGCLRSWLDQGLNDVYSCPTCRKPLFAGRTESEANPRTVEVSRDEQLARQLERQNSPAHPLATGLFPAEMPSSVETDPSRNLGLDPSWLQTWSDQGIDVAGPSTTASRSVGLGRVQMMMRHLASVGESYAQTALDDAAWSLWPMNPSQASTSTTTTIPPGAGGRTGGLHLRTVSNVTNESLASILAMAETVREVMPHVPDEIIFQDLQRTNSVAVTVNNLLQM